MANEVYANMMEVACKAAAGKAMCSFPDVCMTPPQTPATPPGVPIPYPNTGMASDCSDGSSTVKISGEEVMLKNKSYFKKSTGDEAGCAPKKGIATSKIQGKVYFTAWSMDVKAEGENVVRHFDMTTHNHGSDPPNTIPWLYVDGMDASQVPKECKDEADNFNDKCGPCVQSHPDGSMNREGTNREMCKKPACAEARRCVLTPYNMGCCDGTPHHVVPKSQFKLRGASVYTLPAGGSYDPGDAPCVCVDGHSHSTGTHGKLHTSTNAKTVTHKAVVGSVSETGKSIDPAARWKASQAEAVGAAAVAENTDPPCKAKCIQDQARKGHDKMGVGANDQIRPSTAGTVPVAGGDSEGG